MSVITDKKLEERNSLFIADEIHVVCIVETEFNFMKDKALCKEYATQIYKKKFPDWEIEADLKFYQDNIKAWDEEKVKNSFVIEEIKSN